MKMKWTSLLLLTSALLTAPVCSVSAAVPPSQEAAVTQPHDSAQNTEERININSATAEELAEHLSGVGLKKAQRIVAHRAEHGPFTATEQLMEVNGIGERIFNMNAGKIAL